MGEGQGEKNNPGSGSQVRQSPVEGGRQRDSTARGAGRSQRTMLFSVHRASVWSRAGVQLFQTMEASHWTPTCFTTWAEPPLLSQGLPHSSLGSKVSTGSTLSPEPPPGLCGSPTHSFPCSGCQGGPPGLSTPSVFRAACHPSFWSLGSNPSSVTHQVCKLPGPLSFPICKMEMTRIITGVLWMLKRSL